MAHGLTDADYQVLSSPSIEVATGLELISPNLHVLEDLSGFLVAGTVERNLYARIHGTCSLQMTWTRCRWGIDLVRPNMTITDTLTGNSVYRNLGVYALTTPVRESGEDPVTYDVQGFDRLYLLDREVGTNWQISVGTSYFNALTSVFNAAGLSGFLIDGAAADLTLPRDRVWPLVGTSTDPDQTDTPVTWLRIVNDLLQAIRFRSVWADHDGIFRCQQYAPPEERPVQFHFHADDSDTITGEKRSLTSDVWKTPNKWVGRATNPPEGVVPSLVNGWVQERINQDQGPTSITERGLLWTKVLDYEAASPAILGDLVMDRRAADMRGTAVYEMTSGPFPAAGHADVVHIMDFRARVDEKAQATRWSLPLDGGDMAWTFELLGGAR